jgi:hypothetical protein
MAKKTSMFPLILGFLLLAGIVMFTCKEGFTEGAKNKPPNLTPAQRAKQRQNRKDQMAKLEEEQANDDAEEEAEAKDQSMAQARAKNNKKKMKN